MTTPFNLIDEPWIPCLDLDGQECLLNIRDTLTHSHELREIYDNSPLVTVTLHRLLLAILYRSWALKEKEEWADLWDVLWKSGHFPDSPINDYLTRWHDRFDLFSEKYPFYQTAGLKTKSMETVLRLANEINFAGIFDHRSGSESHSLTPAEASRLLVAAQGFALGFGKSGLATIGEEAIEPPYSADAILLRGLTVWFSGDSVFRTLMLNLVPYDMANEDIASWELDHPYQLRDRLLDRKRAVILSRGHVDRYTWQARLIRFVPEENNGLIRVKGMYFTQGRSEMEETSVKDPMKAYRKDEKEGWEIIPLSSAKATWRDAHALLAIDTAQYRPPQALEFLGGLVRRNKLHPRYQYQMNAVGMATQPGKAGKFLLWRHDRLSIISALLDDNAAISRLTLHLQEAEQQASSLRKRTNLLIRYYLAPEFDKTGTKEPDPKDIVKLNKAIDGCPQYWSRLEAPFSRLLLALADDKDAASRDWRTALETEATAAFKTACNQLGKSASALRAIARVSSYFSLQRKEA